MSNEYDVIVIGGGPAGYPAAIRAAQNKLKVACIDEWKNKDGTAVFGGTCTNAGCIPSKALLESSELYHKTKEELGVHGIKVGEVKFDIAQMQKRKTGIVKASTTGIAMLLKSAGVTALQGHGKLLAGRKVEFTAHDGKTETLSAKHIVLASGSIAMELKGMAFDGKNIVDNWGALDFDAVPKKLAVVGAGVIGLELGSVWRRLGAEVVVLDSSPAGSSPAMAPQVLYRSNRGFDWAGNVAWSPDGTRIAVRTRSSIVEISAEGGRVLARHPHTRGNSGWLIWLRDR